jgi:hypothetical protein
VMRVRRTIHIMIAVLIVGGWDSAFAVDEPVCTQSLMRIGDSGSVLRLENSLVLLRSALATGNQSAISLVIENIVTGINFRLNVSTERAKAVFEVKDDSSKAEATESVPVEQYVETINKLNAALEKKTSFGFWFGRKKKMAAAIGSEVDRLAKEVTEGNKNISAKIQNLENEIAALRQQHNEAQAWMTAITSEISFTKDLIDAVQTEVATDVLGPILQQQNSMMGGNYMVAMMARETLKKKITATQGLLADAQNVKNVAIPAALLNYRNRGAAGIVKGGLSNPNLKSGETEFQPFIDALSAASKATVGPQALLTMALNYVESHTLTDSEFIQIFNQTPEFTNWGTRKSKVITKAIEEMGLGTSKKLHFEPHLIRIYWRGLSHITEVREPQKMRETLEMILRRTSNFLETQGKVDQNLRNQILELMVKLYAQAMALPNRPIKAIAEKASE